jgi:MFS family permease
MSDSLNQRRAHLQRAFSRLTLGGDWALSQPAETRHNLRWFWFDGFFSAASENIIGTYLVLYLLALGASRAQIGFLSSLSSLSAALVLLPGAILVERIGHRKEITVWFGGGVARIMVLLLAIIPLGLKGQALIYAAIAMSVTRDIFNNLPYPAWIAIVAEIIPISGRGRYFGTRNFAIGMIGMAVTLLAGELITRAHKPDGYQIALGLAFIIGLISTYSFSRIKVTKEPPPPPQGGSSLSLPALLKDLKKHPEFLTMAGVAALWNFSLNVAGPFFNVYLVQNLKSTATMVGFLSVVSTIAGLFVQRKLGELAYRWGSRRMQLISGLLIPILPFSWLLVTSPWHIVPINILSGILWGAFNLAAFNYMLVVTPAEQRARYSALYQIIITVSLAAGAAIGSIIISSPLAYPGVFIGSGVGRLTAAVLFARLVRAPEPSHPASSEATA